MVARRRRRGAKGWDIFDGETLLSRGSISEPDARLDRLEAPTPFSSDTVYVPSLSLAPSTSCDVCGS